MGPNLFGRLTINQMLFVSHLVLVMFIIVGMTYTRYTSEWSNRLDTTVEIAEAHLAPHNTFLSGAVAGRNYAKLLMPTTKDTLFNIPHLRFLEISGTSDYQGQPIGVRYSPKEQQAWRTDIDDTEVTVLAARLKELDAALSSKDEKTQARVNKLTYVKNKLQSDFNSLQSSQEIHKTYTLPWSKPDLSQQHWLLDLEQNILHVCIELRNENGGELWLVLDATELQAFRKALARSLLFEASGAFLVSLVLIYWVTLWIVSPLKRLANSMKSDVEDIRLNIPKEVQRDDEIGDLARSYMSLIQKIENQLGVLQQQTDTDPLTGLGSRYKYSRDGKAFLMHHLSHGRYVGYMVCDIDNFKAYNDLYGHIAGDNALCMVASVIGEQVKGQGVAVRLGGEEFVVVIEANTSHEIEEVAKRIHHAIEDLSILHRGNPPFNRVTISVGSIAIAPTQLAFDGEALLAEAFDAADVHLYHCKTSGRNKSHHQEVTIGELLETTVEKQCRE